MTISFTIIVPSLLLAFLLSSIIMETALNRKNAHTKRHNNRKCLPFIYHIDTSASSSVTAPELYGKWSGFYDDRFPADRHAPYRCDTFIDAHLDGTKYVSALSDKCGHAWTISSAHGETATAAPGR